MKIKKTYFMLMVADMKRALAFYRRALALEVRFESPEWSELASGGAVVALHGGASVGARDTGLGFEVDDLEGACAAVREAGGEIVKPPADRPGEPIRLAIVADTEGNRFSIAASKP